MRTTVDLPTPLFRRAKARAAARGETLRALLTRAVAAEVGGRESNQTPQAMRVKLPLFGDPKGPKIRLTNVHLERALAEEDAAALGRFVNRRSKRR